MSDNGHIAPRLNVCRRSFADLGSLVGLCCSCLDSVAVAVVEGRTDSDRAAAEVVWSYRLQSRRWPPHSGTSVSFLRVDFRRNYSF